MGEHPAATSAHVASKQRSEEEEEAEADAEAEAEASGRIVPPTKRNLSFSNWSPHSDT